MPEMLLRPLTGVVFLSGDLFYAGRVGCAAQLKAGRSRSELAQSISLDLD